MLRQQSRPALRSLLCIPILSLAVITGACGKSNQESGAGEPSSGASSAMESVKRAVHGGGDFEGTITMRMETDNQKASEIVYSLKGQRSRMEMNMGAMTGAQGVMLWDVEAGKMTTLMPAMKMYMTMDLKETVEGLKGKKETMAPEGELEKADFPPLKRTGVEETIAGHPCEHWVMGEKEHIDVCIAKGLGYFGMGSQMGGLAAMKALVFNLKQLAAAAAHPEWMEFLEGGAFPLKLTMIENGKSRMSMEATKIERKSLDDSLFTVPSDYNEM
ncbi:MAG: DUF4412 domain-containing protein, partial [Acidobacteria bacterium]|nr:DUF4412 domain-containing protein [Acidobacteriota bacterium]